MEILKDNELLDFLAEGFLQQGASVSYTRIGGASALRVILEDEQTRLYISAEEEVSKMAFLQGDLSEEIIIPVLKTDEEFRLKSVLKRAGVAGVEVQRLPILQRYAWYSRKLKFDV